MRGTFQNGWPLAPLGLKKRRPSKCGLAYQRPSLTAGTGDCGSLLCRFNGVASLSDSSLADAGVARGEDRVVQANWRRVPS